MERITLETADVSARRIGHFGFFRLQFRATLWRQALDWIEQRTLKHNRAQSLARDIG